MDDLHAHLFKLCLKLFHPLLGRGRNPPQLRFIDQPQIVVLDFSKRMVWFAPVPLGENS